MEKMILELEPFEGSQSGWTGEEERIRVASDPAGAENPVTPS